MSSAGLILPSADTEDCMSLEHLTCVFCSGYRPYALTSDRRHVGGKQ